MEFPLVSRELRLYGSQVLNSRKQLFRAASLWTQLTGGLGVIPVAQSCRRGRELFLHNLVQRRREHVEVCRFLQIGTGPEL